MIEGHAPGIAAASPDDPDIPKESSGCRVYSGKPGADKPGGTKWFHQQVPKTTSKREFIYNPFGQRVLKIEKPRVSNLLQTSNNWKYTYYSYDANGQVLAVYDLVLGSTIKKADLNELHVYGASRLGMIEHPISLWNNGAVAYTPGNATTHKSGEMRYEITNYLGNVNAVVNDRKMVRNGFQQSRFSLALDSWAGTNATLTAGSTALQVAPSNPSNSVSKNFTTNTGSRYILRLITEKGSSSDLRVSIAGGTPVTLFNAQQNIFVFTAAAGTTNIRVSQVTGSTAVYYLDHCELVEDHIYEATVLMTADYYPFGMQMPGRNTNAGTYRYGYNGMEKDDETKGMSGSSYTTEFRQYDPRLGRWLSLDPIMGEFPDMSPYVAFDDNPIFYTDPYGLSPGGPDDPKVGDVCQDESNSTRVYMGDDEWGSPQEFESYIGGQIKGNNFTIGSLEKSLNQSNNKASKLENQVEKEKAILQDMEQSKATTHKQVLEYENKIIEVLGVAEIKLYGVSSGVFDLPTNDTYTPPTPEQRDMNEWLRRNMATGSCISCGWTDPIIDEGQERLSGGFQYLGMSENSANFASGSIFLVANVALARRAPSRIWTGTRSSTPVQNAYRHWISHGPEFPEYYNSLQYVRGTKNFLNNSPAGTLTKVRTNGDILKYDPATNTFGVMDALGNPRTMFRPTNGAAYWDRQ